MTVINNELDRVCKVLTWNARSLGFKFLGARSSRGRKRWKVTSSKGRCLSQELSLLLEGRICMYVRAYVECWSLFVSAQAISSARPHISLAARKVTNHIISCRHRHRAYSKAKLPYFCKKIIWNSLRGRQVQKSAPQMTGGIKQNWNLDCKYSIIYFLESACMLSIRDISVHVDTDL